jgi:hypothetical protein
MQNILSIRINLERIIHDDIATLYAALGKVNVLEPIDTSCNKIFRKYVNTQIS